MAGTLGHRGPDGSSGIASVRSRSRTALTETGCTSPRNSEPSVRSPGLTYRSMPPRQPTTSSSATSPAVSVSLESRTPFLQSDLVELALALGADQLIGRSGGKQPLRSLLADLLPSVSFDQPKTGFGVPVASLLRTELREGHGMSTASNPGWLTSASSSPTATDGAPAEPVVRSELGDLPSRKVLVDALRRSSREIVDGERPSRRATSRNREVPIHTPSMPPDEATISTDFATMCPE